MKAKEYQGLKMADPYYVMVLVPDGHYFIHERCANFDEAFEQHQIAVKMYMLREKDVEIVKVVDWVTDEQ